MSRWSSVDGKLDGLRAEVASGEWHLHRPIFARTVFAAAVLLLGLFFHWVRAGFGLEFLVFLFGWYGAVIGFFGFLLPALEESVHMRARFAFYVFEILLVAVASHLLGTGSWLAAPLFLVAVVEWNLLFPGRPGHVGAALAVLLFGSLVGMESAGWIARPQLFPAMEGLYAEPSYLAGVFMGSAFLLVGVSGLVGSFASAGRRKSRELEEANRELRSTFQELRRSRDDMEDAYARLRSAQAELVNSARMATLGTLIAGVAHELNTPLGALNSNHDVVERSLEKLQEILADEQVDETELDEVRRIVRAVDGVLQTSGVAVRRMRKLVASLRSFGRPDRAEVDRVDLHEGLDNTLALTKHEIGDEVEVRREYGKVPPIECYPHQLHQVFMNLILNAAHAIEGPGAITIRTRREDDEVVVEVEDTGTGIPAEHRDRIFEPGFTTKGSRMGMGLGLLICQQVVDRHGGTISVESTVGEGSTFRVRLPLRLPAEVLEEESAGETAVPEEITEAKA